MRHLFLLDPTVTFLNHGSFGACPRPVYADYQRWQMALERQPVEFLGRRLLGLLRQARAELANLVGVSENDVVYVPNVTVAVNMVARTLAGRLAPGDEVLTSDHEYGACERVWEFLSAKHGFAYVRQPVPLPFTTPQAWLEAFWAGVTPRTRVIFLSHITSPTALTLPIQAVCQRARQAGILTVIDGAHTLGHIPVHLPSLGADFYTSNAHKWLCAPKGSALLYVHPSQQASLEPLLVGWGWHSPWPSNGARWIDENEFTGTRDYAPFLATPAAIRFQAEHGWDDVRAQCHQLARTFWHAALNEFGTEPLSDATWLAQMAAIPLPPCEAEALKARLYDDFRIEVPVVRWNDRVLLRISVQGYNTADDLDRLLSALRQLKTTYW